MQKSSSLPNIVSIPRTPGKITKSRFALNTYEDLRRKLAACNLLTFPGFALGVTFWVAMPTALFVGDAAIFMFAVLGSCTLSGFDRKRLSRSLPFRKGMDSKHIDLGSNEIEALVREFNALFELSKQGNSQAKTALLPAHQAILEVGNVLRGRQPESPAELNYVRLRHNEIKDIVAGINNDIALKARLLAQAQLKEFNLERDAAVGAIDNFENRAGMSSLSELRHVSRSLSTPLAIPTATREGIYVGNILNNEQHKTQSKEIDKSQEDVFGF